MSSPKNVNFVKNLVANYPDKDLFTFAEVKALPGQGISVPGAFWDAIVEGTKPRLWSVSKFCVDNGIVLENPIPTNPVPVKEEEKMDLVIETRTNVDEPVNIDAKEYIPSVDPDFVPTGDNYEIISRIIESKEFFPCYIYGISGVGKTASIEHICATNNRPFFRVQITQETMDEDLIGSMKLVNGNTVWQDGPVIKAYRTGGIVVLDECDLNSSLMILQPILEKKPFYIKQTGELVNPKDGFNVFATGNTKGDGTDARYIGTTVLNEAFLERFAITLEQGYLPIEEEKEIAKLFCDNNNIKISTKLLNELMKLVSLSREQYVNNNCSGAYISTRRIRFILKAYKMTSNMLVSLDMCLARYSNTDREALGLIWNSIHTTDEN